MSAKGATLYIATLARATLGPRSKTSGARPVPLSWVAALISSWLDPSGCAETTAMLYLVLKVEISSP